MKARILQISLVFILLPGLFFISTTPVEAANNCTWNASSGNWNEAAKWSCNAVPGASDIVTINNGGTVTLTADASAASLTLSNGTLTGSANLTAATVNWSGGTMSGSGSTTATTALNLSGNSTPILDTRTLNNAGTATWTNAGYFVFANSATFNNQAGKTFTISSCGTNLFSGNGTINNAGTFSMASPGKTLTSVSGFNNSGAVTIQSGALEIANSTTSTSSGAYHIQSGAGLKFSGNNTHNLNGPIDGSGSVEFAGYGQVNGVYNVTGATAVSNGNTVFNPAATLTSLGATLTISGGALDLSSGEAVTVPTLTQTNGTLTGSDNLTAVTVNWSSGTMSGSGSTTATTVLNISGSSTPNLDTRTLNNALTATWTNAGFIIFTNAATFNNQAGATFTITSCGANLFAGAGTINNAGIFSMASPGKTHVGVNSFNNSGTVNVQSGTLEIANSSTSTSSGAYHVQSGAALKFNGSGVHNLSGPIDGGGSVEFAGNGQVNGVYNITGTTAVSSGNTVFNPAATLTSLGTSLTISNGALDLSSGEAVTVPTLTQTGGTLTGSDNLTAATVNWSGGTMSGSGSTTAATELNISGISTPTLETRTLNNAGTATWTNTGYMHFLNAATLNNQAGATFTISSSGTDLFSGNGTFYNAGTLNLTTGRFENIATFKQVAGGVTNLVISGTTPITQFTLIKANNFDLAGTLHISFVGGYTPQIGDHFTLLSYTNSMTGKFNPIILPPLADGFWVIVTNDHTLTLWLLKYHIYAPTVIQ